MSLYRGPSIIGESADNTVALVLSAISSATNAANAAAAASSSEVNAQSSEEAAAASALQLALYEGLLGTDSATAEASRLAAEAAAVVATDKAAQTGEDRNAASDSAANALTSENAAGEKAAEASGHANAASGQADLATNAAATTQTLRDSIIATQGSIGYLPPVAYAAGLAITLPAQTVSYSGQAYAPLLSALPFTTSGTFEAAKFRLIQGVAGVDLAAAGGAGMVGWLQAGEGAVLRWGEDKLRERVSVFDFMTTAQIADVKAGTTLLDVTAPLQAAINTGKKLYAPEGHYKHTGLAAPLGLTLTGDGEGKTRFSCTNPAIANFLFAPAPTGGPKVYKLEGFTTSGGLNGLEYSTAGGAGYIDRSSSVRNVHIGATVNAGIKTLLGMIGTRNENINFENPGNYGLHSSGSDLLGSSTWDHLRASGAAEAGIYLQETAGQIHPNVSFTGLICEGGQKYGIHTYSAQVVLINPHFEQNGKSGNGTTILYADIHGDGNGSLRNKMQVIGGAFSTANAMQANMRVFLNANAQFLMFDGTYFASADIVDCNNKSSSSYLDIRGQQPTLQNEIQGIRLDRGRGVIASVGTSPVNSNPGGVLAYRGYLGRTLSKYTLTTAAFTAGTATQDFTTTLVSPKTRIVSVIVEVTQAFAGAGWTAATINFGKTVGGAQYILAFDCLTGIVTKGLADADLGTSLARATAVQGGEIPSWTATTNTNFRLSVTGGVVSGITAGAVTLYVTTEAIAA